MLFSECIINYLEILQSMFGGEFKFNKKTLKEFEKYARNHRSNYYGMTQTPAFRVIEKTIKGVK